jgi:hypothetical protein
VGAAGIAAADGGRVCASAVAGTHRLTLFIQPTPVRVGEAEVGVLVQDAASGEVRPETNVRLRVHAAGSDGPVTEVAARGGVTENRLLRGATLSFATPGEVAIEAEVAGDAAPRVRCAVAVEAAAPPLVAHWPLLALPPAAVALYVAHQVLAERQAARRRGSRRAPHTTGSHDAW